MLRAGRARAKGEPRRPHARRPSLHRRHLGQGQRGHSPQAGGARADSRAAVRDADRAEGALPGEEVMATVTMSVFRGDARGGAFKDYRVESEEGMVVLDVIHRLQATQARDLACRWNCKAGKCGSCSAEVNGKPRLMCMTRMNLFQPGETISVAPIRAFPLIRDLVTDVSFNYEKARQVPPLRLKPPEPDGTYRMMQEDIDRIQEFHKCIECFLCQDVCHVIRDHEELKKSFSGPRFFIKIAGLDMHPLDTVDRREVVGTHAGIGLSQNTKCCTQGWPPHLHNTGKRIIPMKKR